MGDDSGNIMSNLLVQNKKGKLEEDFLGNYSGLQRNYKMSSEEQKFKQQEKSVKTS